MKRTVRNIEKKRRDGERKRKKETIRKEKVERKKREERQKKTFFPQIKNPQI